MRGQTVHNFRADNRFTPKVSVEYEIEHTVVFLLAIFSPWRTGGVESSPERTLGLEFSKRSEFRKAIAGLWRLRPMSEANTVVSF